MFFFSSWKWFNNLNCETYVGCLYGQINAVLSLQENHKLCEKQPCWWFRKPGKRTLFFSCKFYFMALLFFSINHFSFNSLLCKHILACNFKHSDFHGGTAVEWFDNKPIFHNLDWLMIFNSKFLLILNTAKCNFNILWPRGTCRRSGTSPLEVYFYWIIYIDK
jgi:hypothetical protein